MLSARATNRLQAEDAARWQDVATVPLRLDSVIVLGEAYAATRGADADDVASDFKSSVAFSAT